MKNDAHLRFSLAQFFLDWEMFRNCREN